jgi:hypothetical protein
MADRTSHAGWGADYDHEFHQRYADNHAEAFVHGADSTFYPGEPIGAPPRRRAGGTRSKVFVVLALAGCGWGLVKTEAMWRPWMVARLEDMMAEVERRRLAATALPAAADAVLPGAQQPAPLEPLATKDIAEVPGTSSDLPVATDGVLETAPVAKDVTASPDPLDASETSSGTPPKSEAEASPLPQPTIDPGDPYQKRALAVGLHPELSRVLLSSMSDADYRNAGVAIRKAIAEAADNDKFIWPRQPTPKLALFQVHFVAGAGPDCRRYIVTVMKNGWTTTAQPMEKCGVERPRRSASSDLTATQSRQ